MFLKIKLMFITIGLLCIAGTVFANPSIKVIHPHYGAIQSSFTELATTRLNTVYEINMPLSGHLKRINLTIGQKVKKGQILAQLDQLPWEQEVKEMKSLLKTFTAEHEYQKEELGRLQKLREKHFVSQSAVDKCRSLTRILEAKISETKTKLAIDHYNLGKSTIRSPIDGILLTCPSAAGKWIPVGTPLIRLGRLKDLEVVSEVLSYDAQKLKVGDPVIYTSPGTSIVLKGKITNIEPEGFKKESSLGVEEQRINVISSIEDAEKAGVYIGYRLNAQFLVGNSKKALLVPRFSVLQDHNGQYYVFKVNGEALHKQKVKVGTKTDRQFEITQGLTEKDTVVAQPTADMHEGKSV